MGFGAKLPKAPDPIPPPPPPPSIADGGVQDAGAAQRKAAKGAGIASTIATGPEGLTGQASTAQKTLLGA